MSRLTHDDFFASLSNLLNTTTQKTKGSVTLTQKPLPTDKAETSSPAILIRASDGNTQAPNPESDRKSRKSDKSTKTKLSTVVNEEDLEAFYARYADVCKAGMTGLKKRDRKRGKAKKGGAAGGKVSKA